MIKYKQSLDWHLRSGSEKCQFLLIYATIYANLGE